MTNSLPSGLQSSAPPRPGTRSTMRDAPTARCSASSASGQHGAVGRARVFDRLEREQDAALGVGFEVGDRRRGELARDRYAALALGL